jgi:hypothetical protein
MRGAAGLVVVALLASPAPAAADPALQPLATFEASPTYATSPPGDSHRVFVTERPGRVRLIYDGVLREQPFLDLTADTESGYVERGLLSIAFPPDYTTSGRFYVYLTSKPAGTIEVREYRRSASDPNVADPGSRQIVLFIPHPGDANHNGGQLQFGPDGRLWWGNGDGGGGGDPEHNGQSLARPFAKIMKLNVANPKARWQLVAYGLRNPWRFSFDRTTNDLYIGDVGQGDREEIDYLRRGFTAPVNFGWNHWEGKRIYDSSTRLLTRGRYVPPVVDYSHDEGCSVTGGYVYRGKAVKAAVGRYFYGDYCSGTIWSLKIAGGRATQVRKEPFRLEGLSSFGEDAGGELYATSLNGGLYRLAG